MNQKISLQKTPRFVPWALTPDKARGVRVLKEFLEYAATGRFQSDRPTMEEPDSDFERWFLKRLKQAGYEAHPQVGVAGYRIDIGIVHPDQPGSYILGLECDGATYHSSKAARDRDRLRQAVLEGLNWRIHRVLVDRLVSRSRARVRAAGSTH